MSSVARLTYFKGRGRAEVARWLLAAADIRFVNVCLASHAEFTELRDKDVLLFNQLPLLEIDGLKLTQSAAMCNYVARKAGLDGGDVVAKAMVDMIVGAVSDVSSKVIQFAFISDSASAVEGLQASVDKFFPRLEKILRENESNAKSEATEGIHFVGSSLTMADVLAAEMMVGCADRLPASFIEPYPLMAQLLAHVLSIPSITKFLQDPTLHYPAADEAYVRNVRAVLNPSEPALAQ